MIYPAVMNYTKHPLVHLLLCPMSFLGLYYLSWTIRVETQDTRGISDCFASLFDFKEREKSMSATECQPGSDWSDLAKGFTDRCLCVDYSTDL